MPWVEAVSEIHILRIRNVRSGQHRPTASEFDTNQGIPLIWALAPFRWGPGVDDGGSPGYVFLQHVAVATLVFLFSLFFVFVFFGVFFRCYGDHRCLFNFFFFLFFRSVQVRAIELLASGSDASAAESSRGTVLISVIDVDF